MATVADLFSVTEDMLFLILTYHQVSPAYLNFLSYFNLYTQTGSSDLRFGGFRSQTFFSDPSSRWIPELGRSGLHYQLSFTLRTVLEREEEKAPFIWSKPQVAIYHQFDVKESRALWILAGPRQQIAHLNPDKSENVLWDQVHSSINANTIPGADTRMVASNDPRQRFTASLETILTICEWSLGDFSFYLQHIEEKLDPLTAPNYEDADATPNASSLQLINYWIQELIYCNIKLKDNIQVLQNIEKFYENLTTEAQVIQKPTSAQNPSNPWTHAAKQQSNITSPKPSTDWLASEACGKDIKLFLEQLNRLIHDVKGIKNRASVLRNLASDREGFIQKLLQNKTEKRLSELSELSHDEAKVMRVFQSITLVLLPPTVIATIFSTDIIKFQDLDGGLYSFSWFAFIMFLVFLVPTFALVYGLFYWKRPEVRVAYYSQSSGKNLGEMEPRYTMVIN
ncbi:hypothetical protein QBC35DRAFT_233509 [Podospora australis]|uniref:CorA-like transporter domain-containing protein n=1 Tax=Podospora australis TaxID=1536484 RepID=A0AAN6WTH6_9PEZI|nr:hypothetical protein QBC35DRAFT_233509 [Podospora australis]